MSTDNFSDKSKYLTLFLSLFALHRFYVNKYKTGIAQFILSFFLIGYFWVIYDMYKILFNKFTDSNNNRIVTNSNRIELTGTVANSTATEELKKSDENQRAISKIDTSDETVRIMSKFISQLSLDFDKDKFSSFHGYCTLNLLAVIAYFGDGKISRAELDQIIEIGSLFVKKEYPDKKLAISEELCDIFDSLRCAYSGISDPEERYQMTLYVTVFYSAKIKESLDENYTNENDIKELKKFVVKLFDILLKANGREITENEAILVSLVHHYMQ